MEPTEARPILAAAEAAAAINDYASAERLLREAAAVQERTLGSAHPDLANTFNNLGVVCERAGKIDEAEACYRQAYAIATTAFPFDHPFVATSRQNLEEFCAANGRSLEAFAPEASGPAEDTTARSDETVDRPDQQVNAGPEGPVYIEPPPRTESIERSQEATPAPAPLRIQFDKSKPQDAAPETQGPAYTAPTPLPEPIHTAARVPVGPPVPEPPSRSLPLAALVVLVITFVIVLVALMAWSSRTSNDVPAGTEPAPTTPSPRPGATAAPARPDTTAAAPSTDSPRATTSSPPAVAPREKSTASAAGITVADARLCRTLSTRGQWECAPLGDPTPPGTMFFYTRIVSAGPTKVQHRWYFGDRLEQSVMLDVQPNSGGYRTFSRRTSNARRAGPWRVELRSQDGKVLREERFTVSK